MAEQSERRTAGGCMCGAIRYEAVGEPIIVAHCHCDSCRRHTGAPLVTLVSFEADQVRFTEGNRKIYASSSGVGREPSFCASALSIAMSLDGNASGSRSARIAM